jgi:hypothetical protein
MRKDFIKIFIFLTVLILSIFNWINASVPKNRMTKPKNITHFFNNKMGVVQVYSVMLPVLSLGPGPECFSGIHENTFFWKNFLTF